MKIFKFALLFFFLPFAAMTQLPADFSDQIISDALNVPMGIVFDENGQGYLWEKRGLIHILDTNEVVLNTPLLDIREETADWFDHGINSIALDPNFMENGLFYVAYVVERNYLMNKNKSDYDPNIVLEEQATIGRVTRYQADINTNFTTIVEGSRQVLLGETLDSGIPILNIFHGIGTIVASPDGTLLISVGDATPGYNYDFEGGDSTGYAIQALADGIISSDQMLDSYRAQYLGSMNGKVLRIDAQTGEGVPSNPFFIPNTPNAIQSKIWARGLRNPYRMCLRPQTGGHTPADGKPGILYIGDVGEGGWEELNVAELGGLNFGWPLIEADGGHFFYYNPDNFLDYPNAVNPLYQTGSCTKEFFTFRDLFNLPNLSPFYPNPCNPSEEIPESYFPSVAAPPAIFWSNQRWNQPIKTRVSFYDDNGVGQYIETEDPDSPVTAEKFDGYSALVGVFYQGNSFPETYKNKLFAYDFSGWIRVFDFDENQVLKNVEPFHNAALKITHLAENPKNGALYYINSDSELRKVSYGGNPPPIAVAKADKLFGNSPLTVQFDATESYDLFDLPIVEYQWDFGNGQTSTEIQPNFEFETADNQPIAFPVKLTVTDSLGETGETTLLISVNNTPPDVEITSLETGWQYAIDESSPVELLSQVTDKEFNSSELTYHWDVELFHNVHSHPARSIDSENTFLLIASLGCDGEEYWYQVNLTVTDPGGLSTTATRLIFPDCEDAFVEFSDLTNIKSEKNTIIFDFKTDFENEIDRFEIQKSNDYLHYFPIGELLPNSSNTYSFEDENPSAGTQVYRVKAISKNGKFAYSAFSLAQFYDKPALFVFPNPAQNTMTLQYENPIGRTLHYRLFNAAGSLIFETEWAAQPGQVFTKKLFTNSLGNGVYYYQIIDEEVTETANFMIAR